MRPKVVTVALVALLAALAAPSVVTSGVTCLEGARVNGGVTVRPGASLVVSDGSRINGGLRADGAEVVHVFGTRSTATRGSPGRPTT